MLHLTEMSYLYVVGSRKLYMLLLNCLYLTGQTLAMSIILGIYLSRYRKKIYVDNQEIQYLLKWPFRCGKSKKNLQYIDGKSIILKTN